MKKSKKHDNSTFKSDLWPQPPEKDGDGAAQMYHAIICGMKQAYHGYSQEQRIRFFQQLYAQTQKLTSQIPMVQDTPRYTTFHTFGYR